MIDFHPKAVKNFNRKANNCLKLIKEKPPEESNDSFVPDYYVSHTLSQEDFIDDLSLKQVDHTNRTVGQYFKCDNTVVGIWGTDYDNVVRLYESIQKTNSVKNTVSLETVETELFNWIKLTYNNEIDTKLTDFLIEKFEKYIREVEIWIPIANLHIQSDFTIGTIKFTTLSKHIFDRWETSALNRVNENKDNLKKLFKKYRERFQGTTVATSKQMAESKRALEIAQKLSKESLSLLRIFAVENFIPDTKSYCNLVGSENITKQFCFFINNGELVSSTESITGATVRRWKINNDLIIRIFNTGLNVLHQLLVKTKQTDFEKKLLDTLFIYSNNSLQTTISDRLLYIMIAIENILIRNESEPIMQNISERIALFTGKDINEKKNIIKIVKRTYSLRSSYVHHGYNIDDIELIGEFMSIAWQFFIKCINFSSSFKNKDDFINKIDDLKLK